MVPLGGLRPGSQRTPDPARSAQWVSGQKHSGWALPNSEPLVTEAWGLLLPSTRGAQRGSPHLAAWGGHSSAEEPPTVCGQNEGHEGLSRDPGAFLPFLGCPGPAARSHVHAVHSRGVFSPVPGLMTPGRTWGWDTAGHGGQPLEPQHPAFPGGQRWSRGRAGLGLGHREAPDLPALGEGPWPWSAAPTG